MKCSGVSGLALERSIYRRLGSGRPDVHSAMWGLGDMVCPEASNLTTGRQKRAGLHYTVVRRWCSHLEANNSLSQKWVVHRRHPGESGTPDPACNAAHAHMYKY